MRALPPQLPPSLTVSTSWRELWRAGGFVQNDLVSQSGFGSIVKERLPPFGVRQDWLEEFDEQGAFQPIAFVAGGEPPGVTDLTPYEPNMAFREEQPHAPWSDYAWEAWGHPQITALYSPWQVLPIDDVLERCNELLPLNVLTTPPQELSARIEPLRDHIVRLHASWAALNEAWTPLMKLLVRVQNRYLPEVTGRSTLLRDVQQGIEVEPWQRELESFDAAAVARGLGVEHDQLLRAYWFMVERGIDREPRDSIEWLRRAQPRSAHKEWRGAARRAHDHYQAAQTLRLFLADLTGSPPPRPDAWPLDGRQRFRGALYDHGPVPTLTREELKDELIATGLYPHAVHVVGEGKSEKEFVMTIVSGVIGSKAAAEVGFADLGGSGSASRLPTMVGGFTTYAHRTVVIVDSEGKMAEYVKGLERSGDLPPQDILRFERNLEDSNFTPEEQIEVLAARAANPQEPWPAVVLQISAKQLEGEYERRRRKAREDPGRAGVLLELAEDPAYGGPVRVSKPEFACALAERMLEELDAAQGEARERLYASRPLLRFTLERIAQPLIDVRW